MHDQLDLVIDDIFRSFITITAHACVSLFSVLDELEAGFAVLLIWQELSECLCIRLLKIFWHIFVKIILATEGQVVMAQKLSVIWQSMQLCEEACLWQVDVLLTRQEGQELNYTGTEEWKWTSRKIKLSQHLKCPLFDSVFECISFFHEILVDNIGNLTVEDHWLWRVLTLHGVVIVNIILVEHISQQCVDYGICMV